MVEIVGIRNINGVEVEVGLEDIEFKYKTRFGTVYKYYDEALAQERKELKEKGMCKICGECKVYEDLDMCLTCREKIKQNWVKLSSLASSYNGYVRKDIPRYSWETIEEYKKRICVNTVSLK